VGVRGNHIDFGGGYSAAGDFVGMKVSANVEGGSGFFEESEWDAGVNEGAKEHVAAYAGKTF